MADLGEEIARIRKEPEEPPEGSVVRFTRTFNRSGRKYLYAAILVDGLWYLTGTKNDLPANWPGILRMADSGSVEIVSTWETP